MRSPVFKKGEACSGFEGRSMQRRLGDSFDGVRQFCPVPCLCRQVPDRHDPAQEFVVVQKKPQGASLDFLPSFWRPSPGRLVLEAIEYLAGHQPVDPEVSARSSPSATPRTAMFRSVIMPRRCSPSHTAFPAHFGWSCQRAAPEPLAAMGDVSDCHEPREPQPAIPPDWQTNPTRCSHSRPHSYQVAPE